MKKRVSLVAVSIAVAVLATPVPGASTVSIVGHGQHTEGPTKVLSVAGRPVVVGPLTASFSVGEDHAMCAVGNYGGEPSQFNMLVYATDITSKTWGVDEDSGRPTYTLSGTARSITMVAGVVVEDVLTPFSATGHDGRQGRAGGDYFHISIDTVLFPHTTFGKDLDGNALPLFTGDVAINTRLAGPGE